jgi:stage II sporulation protein D
MIGYSVSRLVRAALGVGLLSLAVNAAHAEDELSARDRLSSLYSSEFRFSKDGVPIVPVAVADGLNSVTIRGGPGLALLPDGEGGPEVLADTEWVIRATQTTPSRLQHWAIVWRGKAGQGKEAQQTIDAWKAKGENPRVFDTGTLFAVSGKVLDRREVLVVVGPYSSFADADAAYAKLQKRMKFDVRGVHTELVERPHGMLEAIGSKTATRIRNEGVLWFLPGNDAAIEIEGTDGKEKSRGSYYGKLYVTLDRRGKLAVVNALPAERLLAGLVPAEIFPRAPMEALKSQAIAARGHLLSKIGHRHQGDPFRLCARTHCQVYGGAGKEHPRTTEAVMATRGELLFIDSNADLVDTVYSASCGGHTEDNDRIWPSMAPAPELRGHYDLATIGKSVTPALPAPGSSEAAVRAFILSPPKTWDSVASIGADDRVRWAVTRSAAEIAEVLKPYKLGTLKAIEVLSRGVSGRALMIRIVGQSGETNVEGELKIRQLFGGLRSSMFIVDVKDGGATFTGGGFGHGVGMCQTGSIGMADNGKTYRDILKHYYPGSRILKLW